MTKASKPAKKAAKKAVKKVAAKKVAAKKAVKKVAAKKVVKKVVAKKAAVKKTAAKKVAVKTAAAKKATAKVSKTTIVADVDVGFGNALYLRGDAPGLSWSKGVPMDCKSATSWSIAMAGVKESFGYKVLINDLQWSEGENFTAKPGSTNTCSPTF
ncbi:MAG: hypothetical protein AAGB46_00135 [Verrucomicrobiota bacterium]